MPRRQYLLSERHVRQRDDDAGDERRPQDAQVRQEVAHLPAASRRSSVSVEQTEQILRFGRAADRERQRHDRRADLL